ncbi:MAG: hypothetical protein GY796_36520 [Chloroflexi bacterium]|nr:hypothetical protein [Chloroflexota bacterium]
MCIEVDLAVQKIEKEVRNYNNLRENPETLDQFKLQIVKRCDLALAHDTSARKHFSDNHADCSDVLSAIWQGYTEDKEKLNRMHPDFAETIKGCSVEDLR